MVEFLKFCVADWPNILAAIAMILVIAEGIAIVLAAIAGRHCAGCHARIWYEQQRRNSDEHKS